MTENGLRQDPLVQLVIQLGIHDVSKVFERIQRHVIRFVCCSDINKKIFYEITFNCYFATVFL